MTDDKIRNLNVHRADRENDSRLLTVTDCLEDAAEASRDGQWTKCLLVFYREGEKNSFRIDMSCAGLTTLEARGLMLSWIKEEILEQHE